MNLFTFVTRSLLAAVIDLPGPQAPILEVPRPLFNRFLELRDVSEDHGIEFGCNLYWDHGEIECGEPVEGSKEATPLNSSRERLNDAYIGDFHVHPYRRRLHEHASIGPSVTDLQEMLEKRPARLRVGVFFVFAGPILHLVFLDPHTLHDDDVPDRERFKIQPDLSTLSRYQTAHGIRHDHPFHTMKPRGDITKHDPEFLESLAQERRAFGQIPTYHLTFHQANLTMNRQFAAIYDYSYYLGNLESPENVHRLGTDEGQIVMVLQPRPVWAVAPRDSTSTGFICCKCSRVHSPRRSTVFGRWHRCRRCWSVYCAWCGDALERPVYLTRERACDRLGCGGRTELID